MRNFRLLWAASTVSSIGTWLLIVAVPVHIFETTGSALATSLALAVESLPALVLGPWAGVLVDRWDRRWAMAGASAAAAAGVALMLLDWIYLGLLTESVAAVFLVPASRALLPSITGTGPFLAKASTLMSVTSSAIRMTGPLLGTFIYVQGGLTLVVLIDIASYLFAAAIVLAIRVKSRSAASDPVWRDLKHGMRYVRETPVIRGLLLSSCAFWTANAGLTALLVPFLVRHLGVAGSAFGYLITALGLGYLAGSGLCRWLLLRPPGPTLAVAYAAAGLSFLVMFTATSFPVTIAGAFLAGIPGAVIMTVVPHTIQACVPDALLGRTSAAFWASDAFAALAGALIAGGLSALIGIRAAVILFSIATFSTGPISRLLMRDIRLEPGGRAVARRPAA